MSNKSITHKPTVGVLLNTALNPLASRLGQQYLPKAFKPTGDKQLDATLFSALALAATYGSLTGVTRMLSNRLSDKGATAKKRRTIASYIASQQPFIGAGLHPSAYEEEPPDGFAKVATSILSNPETWSMLIPVLAMAGASYGAYKVVDRIQDKKRLKRLDDELAARRAELTAVNTGKLLNARGGGHKKESQDDSDKKSFSERWGSWLYKTTPGDDKQPTYSGGFIAALMLAAAASFGAGAIASKRFFDSRDPARMRLKELTEAAREKALANKSPVLMPMLPPSDIQLLNKSLSGSPRKLALPAQSTLELPEGVAERERDPADETMQALQR